MRLGDDGNLVERLRLDARMLREDGEDSCSVGLWDEAADRIELYREALAPFAREAEDWPDKMDCEGIPAEATDIKIGDLRKARAVLSGGDAPTGTSERIIR